MYVVVKNFKKPFIKLSKKWKNKLEDRTDGTWYWRIAAFGGGPAAEGLKSLPKQST